MAVEGGIILKVVEVIKSVMYNSVKEYVGHIRSCDKNLGALHNNLKEVSNKKDYISRKVKEGNDNLEEITREAASWLRDVWFLAKNEELKGLMYKDMVTAKIVLSMMEKKDLKRRLSEESEMQELVIKVLKRLKEEMENPKEEEMMRKMMEVDYKKVAEVLVEVMKDTIEEFKKLMKEDGNMVIIATRTLKDRDLAKLTKGDPEMEKIVEEATYASDVEEWPNHEDIEFNVLQPLLDKIPATSEDKNIVKEAAIKLFTPLAHLLTPLGKLMDDSKFKKVMPEAEGVRLGWEVIHGLLINSQRLKSEMYDNTKPHSGRGSSCCFSLSLRNDHHGRYQLSKAAQSMAKHIKDDLIDRFPRHPVTSLIRSVNMKPLSTDFLKGLDSRTKLLKQILKILNDDQVDAVGVIGMGGTGKTTLAKEVRKRVNDIFSITVMVEVSDTPDIARIQAAIAASINLSLDDAANISQRAIRLHMRLISEKERKVLIIFDNVWKRLNLEVIGIPRTCKILLTTRVRDVCRDMDVQDVNILQVGLMNTTEARHLLKSQAGNQVDQYKTVVDRLLRKCGGLPLAIVATANSLKNKDLCSWDKFADDLEKPSSSQVSGDYQHIYSILDTSYKFIEIDEKRRFFLLASLFPLGSSASTESLMRYGIGLNLFENVNKLSEAMERANTWVKELVLSSMLLEGEYKGHFKIHDVVRAFLLTIAAKEEGHEFMVEGIPCWLDDETFKKYTAMTLISRNDYFRLSGVKACKLQILILNGDLSENVNDLFFGGMVNLMVLAMSNMNFQPSLPESMRDLKKLRTLCMDSCKLGDIKQVGDLVNLLVLSLRKSFVEELPIEIGELCKLRLLDLTGCVSHKLPLIPTSVLGKLTRLEGLYMSNNRQTVFETKFDDEETDTNQPITLPYLNVLEATLAPTETLPINGQSIHNVDKFRVIVGKCELGGEFFRDLHFNGISDLSGFLEKGCLMLKLLKKAEFLGLRSCDNFEHLVPLLDQDGFRDLRSLELHFSVDIKCIVDGRTTSNLIVFPRLRSLRLSGLQNLERVYNGVALPGTFANLQTINLFSLNSVLYVLPFVPHNLNDISVSCCELLKFLFIEDEETQAIQLPFLKRLKLNDVPSLVSLVGPKDFSNTDDTLQKNLQGQQYFFDGKIVLPSLELLGLEGCGDAVNLWSKDCFTNGFQNLKDILIQDCKKLSTVGSHSVFSILVQLETLRIRRCQEMREIISLEETEESEIGKQIISFPQLKYLELENMSNLENFYEGGSNLEFSKLKNLKLCYLEHMSRFAKLENSSALFHDKIDFPCLEVLEVSNVDDEVIGLWDMQALRVTLNPAPMLRQLTLGSTAGLRHMPSVVSENLTSLSLKDFEDDKVLFGSSGSGEKKWIVRTYLQLPNLEKLTVESSPSLEELFEKEDCNGSNDALKLFCGQVKTLKFVSLPSLHMIPLHLFKGLASLSLYDLRWKYIISADLLGDSLQQLQFLKIEKCDNMEALVMDVGSLIRLPQLQKLWLRNLKSFVGFSPPQKGEVTLLLPSLKALVIMNCASLEHCWSASIVAPKLQYVTVSRCDKMRQFLVGNPADLIELQSLQIINIQWCNLIEAISSGSLKAPKLRKVKLSACQNVKCILAGNPNNIVELELPSLEIVDFNGCTNLRYFSLGRLVAPRLTQVQYNGKEFSMLSFHDLNHFLQKAMSDQF